MTHSPAAIIRRMLIDLDYGSESGDWPIGVAFMPETPDEIMCVVDRSGKPDGRIMRSGERIRHPGFQIMFRGPDYEAVYDKMITVAEALDAQRRTVVYIPDAESYIVHSISRMGEPLPLGVETDSRKRRHSFSVNATMTVSLYSTPFSVAEGEYLVQPDGEQYMVPVQ